MADSLNMNLDSYIKEQFGIEPVDIKTYSPLTLAYIGDGVYDLIIRTLVVGHGNTKASKLHQNTSDIVKATAQSRMVEILTPYLTEEEADVYRRGRNAKSPTTAKNASVADYRRATGLEALVGYLYLSDRMDRLLELLKIGLEKENIGWMKN